MATFNYTVETNNGGRNEERFTSCKYDYISRCSGAGRSYHCRKNAADHVCANVNGGFYSLIRSQIS